MPVDRAPGSGPIVEWTVASRPIAGERQSGDLHVVAAGAHQTIVGVIDGLGHGPEAAVAAERAAAAIVRNADEALIDVAQRCHADLRDTRGAAMSIAAFSFETPTMSWLGVGNVEGNLFHADPNTLRPREALLSRGGVVGYRLPTLRETALPVSPDDMLIFATDGIRTDFSADSPLGRSIEAVADSILAQYAKASDDALVLVVRYRGLK